MRSDGVVLADRQGSSLPQGIMATGAEMQRVSDASPGMLIGRPDLAGEVVMQAVADRLAFEGADPTKAAIVLRAARSGKPVAQAFLRRVVLPPPRSPLAMPVQSLLKRDRSAERGWPILRLVSRSR